MTTKSEDFPVTLKWSILRRIAGYYQFPTAVFFLPDADALAPDGQTREKNIGNNAKEFRDKVIALVEEYYGE